MPGVSLIPVQYLNFYDLLVCFLKKEKKMQANVAENFMKVCVFFSYFSIFFYFKEDTNTVRNAL